MPCKNFTRRGVASIAAHEVLCDQTRLPPRGFAVDTKKTALRDVPGYRPRDDRPAGPRWGGKERPDKNIRKGVRPAGLLSTRIHFPRPAFGRQNPVDFRAADIGGRPRAFSRGRQAAAMSQKRDLEGSSMRDRASLSKPPKFTIYLGFLHRKNTN